MNPEEYMPLIRQALADFDFIKVHEYMVFKNWEWYFKGNSHIPSIGDLYQESRKMPVDGYNNYSGAALIHDPDCKCGKGGR